MSNMSNVLNLSCYIYWNRVYERYKMGERDEKSKYDVEIVFVLFVHASVHDTGIPSAPFAAIY